MENKKSCSHKPDGEKSYDMAGNPYAGLKAPVDERQANRPFNQNPERTE